MNIESDKRFSAVNDFYRLRNQATLKEIIARFSGKSTELLSYEEVRQKLRARKVVERGLQDIPLDAIVGSVGRYSDFTRDFLPRRDSDKERWTGVKLAIQSLVGVPPIDVYQLGGVYFVIDGNHRVSVARQQGATHIQAYVTEVRSRVSLSPDIQPDDLITKAEYADFLEKTRLDEIRPEANLSVTAPGKYPLIEEHIEVHKYLLAREQNRDIPYAEAVADWYDTVYSPAVELIRESGILHYFPQRTETDLYLWISRYKQDLERQLGWSIRPETAIANLATQYMSSAGSFLERVSTKLLDLIIPERLESGPGPGQWRSEILAVRNQEQLFSDILVPLDGKESGWRALSQAFLLAKREAANLHGLHVVADEADRDSLATRQIIQEYEARCQQEGIESELAVVVAGITAEICNRARWTDLVVTSLLYPPGPQILDRLDSGFQELIQRCPRPVLAVPQNFNSLDSALLAYDGSPKSEEALFVATHIALRWKIPLHILTSYSDERLKPETLLRARTYLEDHGIDAEYYAVQEGAARSIIELAETKQIDLIIMGGYGVSPVIQVVIGSTVDQVLREANRPVLICR